jgi:hypothetical protein
MINGLAGTPLQTRTDTIIMNPMTETATTVKEFVQRALRGDRNCKPTGDHLAFAIEINSIDAWWHDTTANKGLRQWILMNLLEGEARARKSLCTGLMGRELSDMCNPDVPWDEAYHLFNFGANRCTVCMEDIGPDNPRQLCGKTFCYNSAYS